jgi:crossover junction endodeoxyribonuclease RusA
MTSPDTGRAGEVRVELPWPDKRLSPNARVHWSAKARAVKDARILSWFKVSDIVGLPLPRWPAANLEMVFCPPDKRRRDADNLIAATKAHRDGISDALGTDDSKFHVSYSMGSPVKGGAVIVTIRGIE